MIVSTPTGIQFLIEDGNIFASDGRHVARMDESLAFGPNGKYFGTLVEHEIVFEDEACLKIGSMFIPESHVGFTPDRVAASSGREPGVDR